MNEKELIEEYDELFELYNTDDNSIIARYGIECMSGWYSIINRLCFQIRHYVKQNEIESPKIAQIKQKFGGMRFYICGGNDDYIRGMIRMAESMSFNICEKCGNYKEAGEDCSSYCEKCREENKNKWKRT